MIEVSNRYMWLIDATGRQGGKDDLKVALRATGWMTFVCCLTPMVAQANPVMFNPSSFLAFGFVAFAALVVEAGVVALVLTFAGLSPFRFFLGFLFANVTVFLFVFCPLLELGAVPWFVLEILVVAVDALAIKVLSQFDLLQGVDYRGVGWRLAGSAALVGNGVSFFVGVIANGAPWLEHTTLPISD
jgi:hypothetical protein